MKIWKWDKDSMRFDSFSIVNHNEVYSKYFLDEFIGKPIGDGWGTIHITTYQSLAKCDCSGFGGGVPIFSEHAIRCLDDLMKDKVEILPLIHDEGSYFAINVINVLDCIDFDQAIVRRHERYPSVIAEVLEYEFIPELVKEQHIFKVPQFKGTAVYVSDEFRNRVIEKDLKGFEFTLLWDSNEKLQSPSKLISEMNTEGNGDYSFNEVQEFIEEGRAFVSVNWKIQKNKEGSVILGSLMPDGSYFWISPIYYPPVLLDMRWSEVSKSDK
jgi:hypothetical protein